MLHDPAWHEPLRGGAWDPAAAEAAIERIADAAETAFDARTWWPVHPRDVEPGDADVPSTTLYFGAAGVLWALERLRGTRPPLDGLLEANRTWLAANGFAERDRASYLMGDTPILMLAGDHDAVAALVAGNREHPARELMWGAPGTMLAAAHLHERTGEARWAQLFRDGAATLWLQLETARGIRHWTQDLYGQHRAYLDGVHGFVATALVLIRGRALLGDAWPAWREVIVETVSRTAIREGAGANWPALLDRELPLVVQVCHGAPGFVVCLADIPGDDLDELLVAAGETTWAAAPLAKGPGLCHGTAGNGYAFLKLHARTGDERWLERARAFAMHAIAQSERDGPRHSLWTGDLGLALYLRDCLRATAVFPTLDAF